MLSQENQRFADIHLGHRPPDAHIGYVIRTSEGGTALDTACRGPSVFRISQPAANKL